MADYVKRVRTEKGDLQIDYTALANLPTPDTTLTKPGEFADAKATGDAIKQVFNGFIEGVLPIKNGGTGATTATGAEYNISGGITELETDMSDDSNIVIKRPDASETNGAFAYKTASSIWNYISSKFDKDTGAKIFGDMMQSEDNMTDESQIIVKTPGSSEENSVFAFHPISSLWSYISSKLGLGTSNVVPITNGGTGATTVQGAQENLGIIVSAAEPDSPLKGTIWLDIS